MRKIIRGVFIATCFILFCLKGVLAAEKYGYVDLSRIFDSYEKTKQYDEELEKQQKIKEKERDTKESEIKKLEEKMNLLSEDKKKEQQKDFETRRQGLYEFMQQASIDLRKERDEKIKEILVDIQDIIDDYAKKKNFTLIFNDRVFLYADKSLDVTNDIIKILNESYKKKK